MNIVDDIFTLFAQRGSAAYFGEAYHNLSMHCKLPIRPTRITHRIM